MKRGDVESKGLVTLYKDEAGATLNYLRRLVEGPPVIDCIVDVSVNLDSSMEPPPKLPIYVLGCIKRLPEV